MTTRVLVVEDENIVAMDLRASLERLGHQVIAVADNAADAERLALGERPNLILMDVRLRGDADGIEAATRIRRSFDVPVVFLTAYSDPDTIQRAQASDPYGYLLKPFDDRELHIVTEMALYRHRAEHEHRRLLEAQAAEAAVKKDRDWQAFLADVSATLALSLDVERTLDAVARLAVPRLADWALVHLKEGNVVHTRSIHHAAGREAEFWSYLRRYPVDPALPHGFPHVIRTGTPELLERIDEALLERAISDESNLALLRSFGFRAHVVVPLEAHGVVLGALTLAVAESDRQYTVADLSRALELARRCAAAIQAAQLYQVAQQAIAVRDEFLSIASHELRTPLAGALLAVHNLQRELGNQADLGMLTRVGSIHRQLQSLSELAERLLDVSRIHSAGLEIEPEQMDLAALARDVVGRFATQARLSATTVSVEAPDHVVGTWDRTRLGQVLTNLLRNALTFAAGTNITITVTGDAQCARIVVRDQGPGIDSERQAVIFDRFARGVSSRHYGGLGLGLYIARHIANAHGGSIAVESTPGHGAAFTIVLPRHTQAAPPLVVPTNIREGSLP